MVEDGYKNNARHLGEDLEWFRTVVETRFRLLHGEPCGYSEVNEVLPPKLNGHQSAYRQMIEEYDFKNEERLLLLFALMPQVLPHLLDDFLASIDSGYRDGGTPADSPPLVPNVDTALFLLAGDNLEKRFKYKSLFDPDNLLTRENFIELQAPSGVESLSAARIVVSSQILSLVTTGEDYKPCFGPDFPAKKIITNQEWKNLHLSPATLDQIDEIKGWISHGETLLYDWGLIRKLSPGYKCLFHGPSGTGKTMTAMLLGKQSGIDVYRVDLSMVISKYVGETEKNIQRIFDMAARKRWILFLDEAEAFVARRLDVKSSNDIFNNQQVAYLLQRLEDHDGIIIAATNMKNNMDDAFLRRFQNMVEFPMPNKSVRLKIWQSGFSEKCVLEDRVDMDGLADQYELTGGAIMNVVRYASLMALEAGGNVIMEKDILRGIQREYLKEGRSV